MLEYLYNMEKEDKTIKEFERISQKGIYIGCIRYITHTRKKTKHKYSGTKLHLEMANI